MITIYAEKPDMGTKIAAALDAIHLDSGISVSFDQLERYEKAIRAQRTRDGYFRIRFEDQDITVTWGFGHMCGLKQAYDYYPEYRQWSKLPLPYIPSEYGLKLTGPQGQYDIIRNLFQKSTYIICATDNDREGDLIFYYLYSYMNCKKPFKRAIFNKQSKEEFVKAFSHVNLIDSKERKPVIDAGRARSAGDFIVGAGPTVAMTLKYPGNHVLSVGRVQTAVLNMPVTREKEIDNFRPTDYWVIAGRFTTSGGEQYIGVHRNKRFTKKEEADRMYKKLMSSGVSGTVSRIETKKSKKGKPYLYSLASLQMDANRTYGFSLDRTLELAQSLYEKGYTTYPRTDSVHLPNDMVQEMKNVLQMLFSLDAYADLKTERDVNGNDRHYFDSSKVESHYAIVPTTKRPQSLEADEQKLYDLIARSAICIVYPEAIVSNTTVETECCNETFITKGNMIIDPGFYQVIGIPHTKYIPSLSTDMPVGCEFQELKKQTEPPKRYTAASLLNAMINCGKSIEDEELKRLMANGPGGKPRGLGRPSSQASIVKTLESRGYIQTRGKTIYPTDKGMKMIECFPVEELKSAVMTAQWEKRLDDIESGRDTYEHFMKDLEERVCIWTNLIVSSQGNSDFTERPKEEFKCPVCGKPLFKSKAGYGCTGYRTDGCRFFIGKVAGKQLTDLQMQKLLKGQKVGVRGLQGKKGSFNAVLYMHTDGPDIGKIGFQSISG